MHGKHKLLFTHLVLHTRSSAQGAATLAMHAHALHAFCGRVTFQHSGGWSRLGILNNEFHA